MNKEPLKHPREARILLPLFYDSIKKLSKKETDEMIETAMLIGDSFWDELDRGLKLIKSYLRK